MRRGRWPGQAAWQTACKQRASQYKQRASEWRCQNVRGRPISPQNIATAHSLGFSAPTCPACSLGLHPHGLCVPRTLSHTDQGNELEAEDKEREGDNSLVMLLARVGDSLDLLQRVEDVRIVCRGHGCTHDPHRNRHRLEGAAVRACAAGPRYGLTTWSCRRQHTRAARAPSPVPLRPRRAHTPGALGRHRIPEAAQLPHNALAPGSALPPTLRATSPRVATPVSRDRSGALPASPPLPPLAQHRAITAKGWGSFRGSAPPFGIE